MPGFNISIGNIQFPEKVTGKNNLKYDCIKGDNFVANKFTLRKFQDDKLFVERDKYLLILEGIILNKSSLIKGYESWESAVISLYLKKGNTFFNDFRGSFSGALYDKNEDKWIVFTDHIGSKHIYYSKHRDSLLISSEIADLYTIFKEKKLSYSLDQQGAYMLLSYGFMLDNYTLCEEIRKLKPGTYITYKDRQFHTNTFYTPPEEYNQDISEEDTIEKVDELFRKAVQLQFDKDQEYEYEHLVALSGGLDSRMTSWVAHDMGYTDQLNFTFSQSDYLDETIAKEIAADLKHEWIFKALDNGVFLREIDEINKISGGQVLYYSLAHGNSIMKHLNFEDFGILHSGQLGDVILGSYIKKLQDNYSDNGNGAYSQKLLCKVDRDIKYSSAKDLENFMMRERGFNGVNTALLRTQEYTETHSPFYDIDLFNYCMKLPLQFRINHKLYKKWILKHYPKAAEYVWESINAKLTISSIKLRGREIPIKQILPKIMQKLKIAQPKLETKNHMNPLDYWYKTNSDIRQLQDQYFKTNIDRLDINKELKKDCMELYKMGRGMEKNQVLTLLSAMRNYF